MPCATATAIFILGQCGIPWREALHELPASLGNQLMACHWLSMGLEIESPTESIKATKEIEKRFKELSNRKHEWLLELK